MFDARVVRTCLAHVAVAHRALAPEMLPPHFAREVSEERPMEVDATC
jgi:hypothetical protein